MSRSARAAVVAASVLFAACGAAGPLLPPSASTTRLDPSGQGGRGEFAEQLRVRVLEVLPHDPAAFTEGLLIAEGVLYESTGLTGRSEVRRVDLRTGEVLGRVALPAEVFGEGLALLDGRLYALTWHSGTVFVLDPDDLELLGTRTYDGEGWGLCADGTTLWQSDGTSRLRRRHPDTFVELGGVDVHDENGPVEALNELEWVDGVLYANVWRTARIARIDPATGRVTAWIDASGLGPANPGPDDVLNGIAHDPSDGTFQLTGKRWGVRYRVRFDHASG